MGNGGGFATSGCPIVRRPFCRRILSANWVIYACLLLSLSPPALFEICQVLSLEARYLSRLCVVDKFASQLVFWRALMAKSQSPTRLGFVACWQAQQIHKTWQETPSTVNPQHQLPAIASSLGFSLCPCRGPWPNAYLDWKAKRRTRHFPVASSMLN